MSEEHAGEDGHSPNPSYMTAMELIVVSMVGFMLPVFTLLLLVKKNPAIALVIAIPLLVLGLAANVRSVMALTMRDD